MSNEIQWAPLNLSILKTIRNSETDWKDFLRDLNEKLDEDFQRFFESNKNFISELKIWTWNFLGSNFDDQQDEESSSSEQTDFFLLFYLINQKFLASSIELEVKVSFIFPPNLKVVENIFERALTEQNERHQFFHLAQYNFDILALFLYRHSNLVSIPIAEFIFQRFLGQIFLSEVFIGFLKDLENENPIITEKREFFLKITPFYIATFYQSISNETFQDEKKLVQTIGQSYGKIVLIHSRRVSSWSNEFLDCLTTLTSVVATYFWLNKANEEDVKVFLQPNQTILDFIQSIIDILCHDSFARSINGEVSNSETILIDHCLTILLWFAKSDDYLLFFRSQTKLLQTFSILDCVENDRINLLTYHLQFEILSETEIERLNIVHRVNQVCFFYLRQAWTSPSRSYNKVHLEEIIRGLLNISKNDVVKITMANETQLSLLIELLDFYPIVYEILWSLSFHQKIRRILMENQPFRIKLDKLDETQITEDRRRIILGLRWTLNAESSNLKSLSNENLDKKFDVMISYSHKDKELCLKIHEQLIQNGYRVWVDVKEMHGNLMEAMAQAIESSTIVILCISEDYQRNNYCRSEAQYAFKRQVKLIPVLAQKSYQPDGWLGFLTFGSAQIDFTKYPFSQSIQILLNELKTSLDPNVDKRRPIESSQISVNSQRSRNTREWSNQDVRQWLLEHKLYHMAHLLSECDGPTLIHLSHMIRDGVSNEHVNLFQQDSLRVTGRSMSMIELARFRALIEKEVISPVPAQRLKQTPCCMIM